MKKNFIKTFFLFFLFTHLIFSYVLGTLNPFEFGAFERFLEVLIVLVIFIHFVETL